jgi:hypothetical protein
MRMHERGINARYLGDVLARLQSTDARSLVLTEMVARTVKWELRQCMRSGAAKVCSIAVCVADGGGESGLSDGPRADGCA